MPALKYLKIKCRSANDTFMVIEGFLNKNVATKIMELVDQMEATIEITVSLNWIIKKLGQVYQQKLLLLYPHAKVECDVSRKYSRKDMPDQRWVNIFLYSTKLQ